MKKFSVGISQPLLCLFGNWGLVKSSVKREIVGKYRGSLFGILWSLFNPVLMLSVYTFVFTSIFKARWSVEGGESKSDFALILFSGMIVFNFFAECANKAPSLILDNPNYVKKVVFPLEILPWVTLGASFFHMLINLFVWGCAYFIINGIPHISIVYLPFVLLPFVFFIMGISWFLASLGVYLRDVGQFIGILVTSLMFLSPIFYPVSSLSEELRWLLYFNPLTPIVEESRAVLYWGDSPDFVMLAKYCLISLGVFWVGFFWFQKTRKGFSDVL